MAMQVDGIDYSPEGIEAIRQEVIKWRDNSYDQWPEAIDFTLTSSHVIGLLAHLKELKEQEAKR